MTRISLPPATAKYTTQLLAILASGKNLDGTPFTLPVEVDDSVPLSVLVGNTAPIPVSVDDSPVVPGNIRCGRFSSTATTAATTLITIPAGRTWVGTVGASVSCAVTAASIATGRASALISVSGANAVPAPGIYLGVDALAGPNNATGTVGSQGSNSLSSAFTVIAPAGNSVNIQVATTQSGTTSLVDAFANGELL